MTTDRRVPVAGASEATGTVAVIGGGPTGVTVATLLAQYGIDCIVLDRWSEVYPQPRAVHLDDEVYRIVERLGVAEAFAAVSRPALGLRLLDGKLNVLAEFQRDPDGGPHGHAQANMFDQPELEALLRANLTRYPNVELRGDVEVIDITDGEDVDGVGPIRITATDRTTGEQLTISADYVLGCDGANSMVRNRIGSSMRDLDFEQRWLVVDVATVADLHQWEGVHQVCNPDRAGTYMRIGTTRYRWEFRLLPGESADDFATIASLRPLIAPWTADVADDELDLVRVTEYTFRAQLADRWRAGNVFLLGDAAHLTPPFIGQGMGAGLRDAMNLSWKLAGVIAGSLPAAVLDTYEVERKPHARRMIALALNVGRAMTSGGEFGNLARRFVVPRIHLLPGLRNKVLDSETPPLSACALIQRSRLPRRLAGRLCPNAPVAGGGRLDSRLGLGFALVTAVAPSAAARQELERRGAHVHVAEPGSVIAGWLHRGHATAAIVRPDRTVSHAGRDVDALCRAVPIFRTPARSIR